MSAATRAQRPGLLSTAMIATSFAVAIGLSLPLDLVVFGDPSTIDAPWLAFLFNAIVILQSLVGAVIEWRRPGHGIGRLLMLSGALFALLAMGWTAGDALTRALDPATVALVDWGVTVLSYPGIALIAGWLPLLFPTGSLPGPRWRIPASAIVVLSSISLAALGVRPGPLRDEGLPNPFGIEPWPPGLQVLVDTLLLQLVALFVLAIAGLAVRYWRGDAVERHQIRWLLGAVGVVAAGFVGVIIETALQTDDGIAASAVVVYIGVLAMPIAVGVAVTRYRLFEIDRIVSRTLGWALVTGALVAVFAALVVALQTVLAGITQGETLAVAASTLVAFAIFQPVRRRVQSAVDRRFDRARYDAQRTVDTFAEHLRSEVDLGRLRSALVVTADRAVRPVGAAIWLRAGSEG